MTHMGYALPRYYFLLPACFDLVQSKQYLHVMTTQTLAARGTAASLDTLEDLVGHEDCSVEQLCGEMAKVFRVRGQEVALLRVDRLMLKFLYPAELRSAGAIPLSSSAIAARTANNRRADYFNNFASVQHSSVFESVKFAVSDIPNSEMDPQVIQKIMTVPVFGGGNRVAGVIQVSRKGFDLNSAGPDFTPDDLELLKQIAKVVGVFLSRNV
jgi:hypothetical protein